MIKDMNTWNLEFKKLQKTIYQEDIEITRKRILMLHQMTHQKEASHLEYNTFEDEIWQQNVGERIFRKIPKGKEFSIVLHLWHTARIEDITTNIIINGTEQILYSHNFKDLLNVKFYDTGNNLSLEDLENI